MSGNVISTVKMNGVDEAVYKNSGITKTCLENCIDNGEAYISEHYNITLDENDTENIMIDPSGMEIDLLNALVTVGSFKIDFFESDLDYAGGTAVDVVNRNREFEDSTEIIIKSGITFSKTTEKTLRSFYVFAPNSIGQAKSSNAATESIYWRLNKNKKVVIVFTALSDNSQMSYSCDIFKR